MITFIILLRSSRSHTMLGLVAVYYSYYYLLWFDLDSQSNNAPSQQENLISQLRAKKNKTKHYISTFYRH